MKKRTSNPAPQSLAQPKGYSQQDSYLLVVHPSSFPQLYSHKTPLPEATSIHSIVPDF